MISKMIEVQGITSTTIDSIAEEKIRRGLNEMGLPSIDVEVRVDTAILKGVVETYFLKQLAGSLAARFSEIERIQNLIIVS